MTWSRAPRPLAERFWEKVAKRGPDDCWEWTGFRLNGYGKLALPRVDGVKRTGIAHRIAWELAFGEIPAGMRICHRCDNPGCVNVAHLFVGTAKDNTQDMLAKDRAARGTRNPQARLTESDVVDIRRLARDGVTYDELERRYGITRAPLHRIVTGKSWRHVAAPKTTVRRSRRMTDEEVREVRCLRAIGIQLRWIANLYGVSEAAVCNIARGKSRAA